MMARRSALMKDQAKLRTQRRNLSNSAAQLDRELTALESRRKFRCIGGRNVQRKLTQLAAQDKQRYDGSVSIFPVCSAAFRDLLKNKKSMAGFPSKLYTGVPRLRQWLGEVVLIYREHHLDSIVRGLQRLYDGLKSWSDDNSGGIMAWVTYKAILKANGGPFQSKGTGRRSASPRSARSSVTLLQTFSHSLNPTREDLLNINTELCESISSSVKSLSDGASQIHLLFIGSLRTGLGRMEAAYQQRAGDHTALIERLRL
ncbi:uncharacterized protein P884DRAFT_314472 [Thermothelomyces heterothallicus CBS 202.75]|uniref:uncharacterized protein n=1 Tax=Thermothelomyces heterothallicus CBS 202.75 TaxID=1149848 RepID=UPI00374295A5